MKYSITDLTAAELRDIQECLEDPPVDDDVDDDPVTGDDAVEVSMMLAHDRFPKILFGFDIFKKRQNTPRFVCSAIRNPGQVTQIILGKSVKEQTAELAWNGMVINSALDGLDEYAIAFGASDAEMARLAALAADNGDGIGLRLKPGKAGLYRWIIIYSDDLRKTKIYGSLAEVVDAYEQGEDVS